MRKILLASLALAGFSGAQAQVTAVVGHFAPFADSVEGTSVEIQVNGATALTDVVFGDFTDRLELGEAGEYTVEIFPTGSADAAISFTGELAEGDYTLLATGDGANQDLGLLALTDDLTPPAEENVRFRVVHAAPFADSLSATEVSIRTDAGDVVAGLTGVPFGGASDFIEVPAGTYDLKVSSNDGSSNFIDPAAAELPAGALVTIIATGDGANQPLGISALPIGALPLETPADLTATGLFTSEFAGQGTQVQVYPRQDRIVGFIYTFNIDGTGQEWIHFDSCNSAPGAAECATPGSYDVNGTPVTFYRSTGGAFNSGDPAAELVETGSGMIGIVDCDTLLIGGDLGNGAGEVAIEYTRLGDRITCTPGL